MKKIISVVIFLLIIFCVAAQPPKLFKYQGIARDSTGNPVSNDTIALRISIRQGTAAGVVVYKETHNPITNEFGSFNINIGGGTVVAGNFSTIAWGRYNYFQEVEMDITGGSNYVSMGTSQYLSVPYSFSSDSASYSFRSLLADSAIRSFHSIKADSARKGIAPFWVQNNSTGNDTSSVAIFAISNGGAPAIYSKNNGSGESLMVDGKVKINGTVTINGSALLGISNLQVFNSSGSFTVPAGVTKLMVEVWGAGGAGSPTTGGNFGGSGGGGGGYGKSIFSVLPGTIFPVTVGGGGTGVINGSGIAGGTSSFDVLISASGGAGGQFGGGSAQGGGSSGVFSVDGGNGGPGGNNSPNGFGGSAGGGGGAGHPGGGGQGIAPGGGGSGSGVLNSAGGNGANGRVVVWW